jgi:hypothetical protein
MSLLDTFGRGLTQFAANGATAMSMSRLTDKIRTVQYPAAIISMTIRKRRMGDAVAIGDFEDIEVPLNQIDKLNKAEYLGFEQFIIKSIIVNAHTDVIIVHQNRFNKETVIHNGTDMDGMIARWDDFNPFTLKPHALMIMTRPAQPDGVFKTKDGSRWFDARMWTLIGLCALVVLIVVALVTSGLSTRESYTPLAKLRPTYAPEDLHKFSEIRKNTRMPKPYDWEKHVWV